MAQELIVSFVLTEYMYIVAYANVSGKGSLLHEECLEDWQFKSVFKFKTYIEFIQWWQSLCQWLVLACY